MSGLNASGGELVDEIRELRTRLMELERAASEHRLHERGIRKVDQLIERDAEERKALEREILAISEREKRLIGQELHDSIGQQFTGIACMTKVLERKLKERLPDEAGSCAEILDLVYKAMDQLRCLAKGLYPVNLKTGSLTASLGELAEATEYLFDVRCTFECDRAVLINHAETAVHIYRIAQEAVTNSIKHGKAQLIEIELQCGQSESVLQIRNDGVDFSSSQVENKGMGLRIMDHRAEMIGGSLEVSRGGQGGTVVTCVFPNSRM